MEWSGGIFDIFCWRWVGSGGWRMRGGKKYLNTLLESLREGVMVVGYRYR